MRDRLFQRAALWATIVVGISGEAARTQVRVDDLSTDKVRYFPGETARIRADVANRTGRRYEETLRLRAWHLNEPALPSVDEGFVIEPGQELGIEFRWTTPPVDYRGYLLEVEVLSTGDRYLSALDVSSDWRRFPRYGFLTEYRHGADANAEEKSLGLVEPLARRYHLTALQYYDWMSRHERVVEYAAYPELVTYWTDWNSRSIYPSVLWQLTGFGHRFRMASMPYLSIYLARSGYTAPVTPAWGLYNASTGSQHRHEPGSSVTMYVFSPLDSGWEGHQLGQYGEALRHFDFDGVHLDHLGDLGDSKDAYGNWVDLENSFSPLIHASAREMETLTLSHRTRIAGPDMLTFNIVQPPAGTWSFEDVLGRCPIDFVYSEAWGELEDYGSLHAFIRHARKRTAGKAVVMAAYVNRGEPGGPFDEDSVLLTDAAIFAAGGTHIELGDGGRLLETEYFPDDYRSMGSSLPGVLEAYYDFITAYENLLFDPDLIYGDGGAQWLTLIDPTTVECTNDPKRGVVWWVARRHPAYELIHFINLTRESNRHWRDFTDPPTGLSDLDVRYRMGPAATVTKVYFASPDGNQLRLSERMFDPGVETAGDQQGSYVDFTVSSLAYWSMIVIERDLVAPAGDVYEAEVAVRTRSPTSSANPGFTGAGYVELFDVTANRQGVSFYVVCARDAEYDLAFHYANGGGSLARREVYIDGGHLGTTDFPGTGGWTTWGTATERIRLDAGPHQIVVWFGAGAAGTLALDSLKLSAPEHGVKAQYFATTDFDLLVFERTEPKIDFDWGVGDPADSFDLDRMPHDYYSARWTGQISPPHTGSYKFFARTDDGVRLWVDGQIVLEDWNPHPETEEATGEIFLDGSRLYDIRMEYYEKTGSASAKLFWENEPLLPREMVPEDALYPPPARTSFGELAPRVFRRGDADGDGSINLSDALAVIKRIRGGGTLPCEVAGDFDDDGVLEESDATGLLSFLFEGGAPPAPPAAGCGKDPTPGDLGCRLMPCLE